MSQIFTDKIRGAWLIMKVTDMLPTHSPHLLDIHGEVLESNFIQSSQFVMPVIKRAFQNVEEGDTVKMVYFTTKSQLDRFVQKKSPGFVDTGLRYYRLDSNGDWEMLYEDFSDFPTGG